MSDRVDRLRALADCFMHTKSLPPMADGVVSQRAALWPDYPATATEVRFSMMFAGCGQVFVASRRIPPGWLDEPVPAGRPRRRFARLR